MADELRFYACPDCGATVREDWVDTHATWHDEHDQGSVIELKEWPVDDAAPGVAGRPSGL